MSNLLIIKSSTKTDPYKDKQSTIVDERLNALDEKYYGLKIQFETLSNKFEELMQENHRLRSLCERMANNNSMESLYLEDFYSEMSETRSEELQPNSEDLKFIASADIIDDFYFGTDSDYIPETDPTIVSGESKTPSEKGSPDIEMLSRSISKIL